MDDKHILIVGLGNPGEEYRATFHNIGFIAVDFLLKSRAPDASWKSHKELFGQYAKVAETIYFKPETLMNDSGRAVGAALRYFKITPHRLLVIHDEGDLVLGTAKYVFGGRAAGHKGVQSIIDTIGTDEFWRWRIGFRPEKEIERKKAGDLVLRKMNTEDQEKIYGVFASEGARIENVIKNADPSLPSTIEEGGTATF